MEAHLAALGAGVWTTLALTLGAFAIGGSLGFPLALMRRSRHALLRWPAVGVVELLRAVPPLVWLFIAYYVIGQYVPALSPLQAAIGGLGLIASAHMSEVYRGGIDAVPPGQWEAAAATSLSRAVTYRKIVLPQAVVIVIPPAATYLIALLKDSAVASVVGAVDITFLAYQQARETLDGLNVFLVAAFLYLLLSVPAALVARSADRFVARRLSA